jgi:hypothetical protein
MDEKLKGLLLAAADRAYEVHDDGMAEILKAIVAGGPITIIPQVEGQPEPMQVGYSLANLNIGALISTLEWATGRRLAGPGASASTRQSIT